MAKPGATSFESDVEALNVEFPKTNLTIFNHNVAVRVVPECKKVSVPFVAFSSNFDIFRGTIVTFVRWIAFVATRVARLRAYSSKSAGSHRQYLYGEPFSTYHPVAFTQRIQEIENYVEDWCPKEVKVFSLSVVPTEDPESDRIMHT